MACLGVLFSIDQTVVDTIKKMPSEDERINYIKEVIEEEYFRSHPAWVAELVKAWDALHRSLTDGDLTFDNGVFPLSHVVLGGEILCANDDYIITLKDKEQVGEIARAVTEMTKENFQQRYFRLDPNRYSQLVTVDDFEYTWEWFESSKIFWKKAAEENRSVLFTVDQ